MQGVPTAVSNVKVLFSTAQQLTTERACIAEILSMYYHAGALEAWVRTAHDIKNDVRFLSDIIPLMRTRSFMTYFKCQKR